MTLADLSGCSILTYFFLIIPHSHYSKLYTFKNLTDEEATLLEPASCAIHGLDKLRPKVGVEVLLFGAGPTGLILAQAERCSTSGYCCPGRYEDGLG
jgi:hypothetical protein